VSSRTIRLTLTYEEAEALLLPETAARAVRLRSRGKLTAALLAKRDYQPPVARKALERREGAAL